MRLKLTAGQGCYLHGWMTPKQTLSWQDVQADSTLTLPRLLSSGLSAASLHQLQPDAGAWVRAMRVTLSDCPFMIEPWGAHPVRDFGADLGDIAGQNWGPDLLQRMGVTYRDLVDVGLTPPSMALFTNVTLMGWAQLGLTRADVACIPEPELVRLFRMTKADVMRSVK
jgi:hypothetical protein